MMSADRPQKKAAKASSRSKNVKREEKQYLPPLRKILRIPPLRSGWISRSRFDKRMDEEFECKLTHISAPAKFELSMLIMNARI